MLQAFGRALKFTPYRRIPSTPLSSSLRTQRSSLVPRLASYSSSATRLATAVASSTPIRNTPSSIHNTLRQRPLMPNSTTTSPSQTQEPLQSPFGSFDLLQRTQIDQTNVIVSKWQSRESGLTVVHLDYDAPIVKGYFVVGTEIFNDSGCPHTLEHLVFLGSEKYPYKGVLDNLANRAFSAGTNAWTDTDHTAYTIETAGQEGFLQLLPVYVDHILYPTMTDAGFVTEVHHINEKAENAGVVYSEMQGRENTSGDLAALRQQRLFYPDGSAYRSETGGLMEALRKLTIEEIRHYHGSYYVPHNLCLVVSGKLSTKDLLTTIQEKVEPRIAEHKQTHGPKGPAGWKRPFMETPSGLEPVKITERREDTVEFPEKDESQGELSLSFVGPNESDYLDRKAIDILGVYLTDSPVAPLTKEFVEIASPLCTYIGFYENSRANFVELSVYFGSVPTESLLDGTLENKFIAALKRIVQEGFDMERMALVLKRERLKLLNSLESSGGDYFSGSVIADFLYGPRDGSELAPSMADIARYEELSKWTAADWANLLQKFYINNNPVVIRAKPSASLQSKLETTEKSRINAQREKLGPSGLEHVKKLLEEAKAEHEKLIPNEILTSFPVPDVKSISWIPVQSARSEPERGVVAVGSGELDEYLRKDGGDLPVFVQYDHVKSDFVAVCLNISTSTVPVHLKPYIWLYLSSFFSLPITRSSTGVRLSHEDVVKQLDNDTVAYEIGLGSSEYFTQIARVAMKVESANYGTAIAWLRDLLYKSEFDIERLEVTIAKLQQSLPELKRDGNTVANALYFQVLFDNSSSSTAAGLMEQIGFIPKLVEKIKSDPQSVVKDLEELRKYLVDPANLRANVTGNVLGVAEPRSAWSKNYERLTSVKLAPVPWTSEALTPLGKKPVKKGYVLSLPTIESSFALHVTSSITGWDHPEAATLRLACEVLDGTESFLWKYIRGSGLAYGANMSLDLENGLLSLQLYRCPNSYEAFAEAAKVVKGLADGSIPLDDTALDAARSSLVYNIARSLGTPFKAASMSFVNQTLRGVSFDHGMRMLDQLQAVNIDQVREAIRTRILPLFEPESSVAFVVSAPSKVEDIVSSLEKHGKGGYEVEKREMPVSEEEMEEYSGSESGSDSDDSMASR